jgi:chitinase
MTLTRWCGSDRCAFLLAGMTLLVACSATYAEQFVLFDVTFAFTKEDADNSKPSKSHYYVRDTMLNGGRPKDWTQPVDYRNGTVHIRTEVIEKPPGGEPTTWTLCYIPNKGQKNGYGCTGTVLYREKGVYEQDVKMTSFWQNDSIVWSEGIKEMHLVIKDGSGGSGHAHKRPDSEKFFPTKMRITMIQVSAGSNYDPKLVPNLPPDTQIEERRRDNVFVGYVYRVPKKINFQLYTHLCHAFVVADEDGSIRPSRSCPSHQLVTDAHKAGVKVLISLGGWGWDKQFAAIVSKTEAENRYLKSVLAIVNEYDYDGIDLDWEYPDTKEEIVGFDRLSRRFRKELDALGEKKGRHMFQTMAVSANPSTLKWLTNKLLLETMDWLNVMTYDFAGERTTYAGHHSPLFASSKQPGAPRSTQLSMQYLVGRGMPTNRLAVGLPLYGRGFAAPEPYASTKRGQTVRAGNYNNIEQLIKSKGWTRKWDDETKNPWAIAPDGSAVIGYDDAESLSLKTDWVSAAF